MSPSATKAGPAPERTLAQALAAARTNTGATLLDLSMTRPTLAVFLRFSGCPFCLEAMHDVRKASPAIEARGTQVVFVHMMPEAHAAPFFEANGVGHMPRISDPGQDLYRAVGLGRGSAWQLMGPSVWLGVLRAARVGKRVGKAVGDWSQMPGSFLIEKGRVVASYKPASQAGRTDYEALACSIPAR